MWKEAAISAAAIMLRLTQMICDTRLAIRSHMYAAIGGETLGVLLGIAGPYLLKMLVDQIARPDMVFARLVPIIFLFAVAIALGGIVASVRHHAATQIVEAISADMAERLLAGRLPEIAKSAEESEARLLGQIERMPFILHHLIDGLLWQAIPLVLQIILASGLILTVMSWTYAATIGLLLASYFIIAMTGAKRYQQKAEIANRMASAYTALVADVLRNAGRVVFNGNVAAELTSMSSLAIERRAGAGRGTASLLVMSAWQCCAVITGLAFLLTFATRDVLAGRLTTGDLVLLQAVTLRLVLPLGNVGFLLRQVERALAEMRDIFRLIDQDKRVSSPIVPVAQQPANLVLDNVGFSFADGRTVLRDISVSVAAGELVVLLGPNGAGKSTLARIMAGVLDPFCGSVRVDCMDLATIPAEQRCRHILYIPQNFGLFARSLGENGLYPPTNLTPGELVSSLRDVHFHADGRPADLAHAVGEGGQAISGGQMQKLELARLTGVDVPIMILDEPTSALDPVSEGLALDRLRYARAGKTLILVSHRRDIVRKADQVIFMAGGRLLYAGTDAMLDQRQDYRDFWEGEAKGRSVQSHMHD